MSGKFNYPRARATAERLIAKFGQSGSIRRKTRTGDKWSPTIAENDYACTLVVLEYSAKERDGALIEAGDRKVYVSTAGVSIPALPDDAESLNAPTVADKIVIGGAAYSIIAVDPLNPGGTVVFWEVQARI